MRYERRELSHDQVTGMEQGSMGTVSSMLETYPRGLGRIDRAKLIRCIETCMSALRPARRARTLTLAKNESRTSRNAFEQTSTVTTCA